MTSSGDGAERLRVRRLEVVDDDGRVRVVVGELEDPLRDDPVFGITVLDATGHPRVSAGLAPDGAWLALEVEGNAVVVLGATEAGADPIEPHSYLVLSDRRGLPGIGWRVRGGGEADVIGGPRPATP